MQTQARQGSVARSSGLHGLSSPRSDGFAPGIKEGGCRLDRWLESVAPCPWGAHAGLSATLRPASQTAYSSPTSRSSRTGLYTPAERNRRDASPWTVVQAVLAPLQFLICAASLLLIVRYLVTGQGYALATFLIVL